MLSSAIIAKSTATLNLSPTKAERAVLNARDGAGGRRAKKSGRRGRSAPRSTGLGRWPGATGNGHTRPNAPSMAEPTSTSARVNACGALRRSASIGGGRPAPGCGRKRAGKAGRPSWRCASGGMARRNIASRTAVACRASPRTGRGARQCGDSRKGAPDQPRRPLRPSSGYPNPCTSYATRRPAPRRPAISRRRRPSRSPRTRRRA